jgi:LuxR family transcriptional regulator, maltose regulon positive regulatory protein
MIPGTTDSDVARLGAAGVVSRPRLFEQLGRARVSVVSAHAGSGKTVLLRSWIGQADLAASAAWVPVRRGEGDPQLFWLSVVAALRETRPGSTTVKPLSAAPDLDGWAIVERLLADLATLDDRVWLVVDDVHELGPEALRQLELLIMRAPSPLLFVLAARHDLRLGLHRLRLEGELAEIRSSDLRFSLTEAEELFAAAGVKPPGLAALVGRTEGWAAGLRLAALSLVGHPDPARFVEQFSGTERTVAEYLLAEVLDRQPEPVRRLLLRTSILDSVNGELADALTGVAGGERILQDLEAANAFVVALDGGRSWFRYHYLFADLLQMELRRAEPDEVTGLHRQAGDWFAEHEHPVQAIQHAQAARDWDRAARLLADHWPGLYLDGQAAVIHELLVRFPAGVSAADAELAAVAAGDELNRGSFEESERQLARATSELGSVPAQRSGRFQVTLGILRLSLARQRGDVPAVAEEAQRLLAGAADGADPGLGGERRALALISLGIAETWTSGPEEAERHLEQGVALARQIGRPYLELTGLAYLAQIALFTSFTVAARLGRQAVELAQRHGWGEDQAAGVASTILFTAAVTQGRLEEAGPWLQRADLTLRAEAEPAPGMVLYFLRGQFELVRGRHEEALSALQASERLAGMLVTPHILAPMIRAILLLTLLRLGEIGRAEAALAGLDARERHSAEMRFALAWLRLAQDDPEAAAAALAPVVDGSVPTGHPNWLVQALLLEAIARDALGDPGAAGRALEHALDLAEPDGVLIPFLLHPAPELLERHSRLRTSHASLISEILNLLSGHAPAPRPGDAAPLQEPLSESELRVLRYLPTNLRGSEIAAELFVSPNTIRSHLRNLYAKLGVHSRTDAVNRARELGLLSPSSRKR